MGNQKMKDIKYIIADNVKLYRKKENLTQMGLAERAELSLDSIKRVEGGKTTLSLGNFLRMADALDVSISYLISENIDNLPEMEQIHSILKGKKEKQKIFLLHMLKQMAEEMDRL